MSVERLDAFQERLLDFRHLPNLGARRVLRRSRVSPDPARAAQS